MKKKRVLVVAGGISSEAEISRKTAHNYYSYLKKMANYQSAFYDFNGNIRALLDKLDDFAPDVVLNALHGKFGEDGCFQSILNSLKIKYTHSMASSSALAMDKFLTKRVVQSLGVDVAQDKVISSDDLQEGHHVFDFPYVIKPIRDGSSCGVHVFMNLEKVKPIGSQEYSEKTELLCEEYIKGRELTVAVFEGKALDVTEIYFENATFYDYDTKYSVNSVARHILPAEIDGEIRKTILKSSEKIYSLLRLRGVSRVDFIYDEINQRLVFLEVNTQPGMTDTSLVPEQLIEKKITMEYFIETLINEASFET